MFPGLLSATCAFQNQQLLLSYYIIIYDLFTVLKSFQFKMENIDFVKDVIFFRDANISPAQASLTLKLCELGWLFHQVKPFLWIKEKIF